MDKRIRKNEICIIGLPRCDFVFSSTRSCFIGYGFTTSTLEMTILRRLLEDRGVQPLEAGGSRAPGQNAFCAKICSKIITSQFCIILLNNDVREGVEIPNPNVNMEYGLMLGFNKYVIPFQRADQTLPFNVAGLDTVKYTDENIERLGGGAIDQAIEATRQEEVERIDLDQKLYTFILAKGSLISSVTAEGDKAIYDLGMPLGFNLLHDFGGTNYMFFGNFTQLRPEAALWRVRMLERAIDGRRATWDIRVRGGLMTAEQAELAEAIFKSFQIWVVVSRDEDKKALADGLSLAPVKYNTSVFSLSDVDRELETLGGAAF